MFWSSCSNKRSSILYYSSYYGAGDSSSWQLGTSKIPYNNIWYLFFAFGASIGASSGCASCLAVLGGYIIYFSSGTGSGFFVGRKLSVLKVLSSQGSARAAGVCAGCLLVGIWYSWHYSCYCLRISAISECRVDTWSLMLLTMAWTCWCWFSRGWCMCVWGM